MQPVMALTVVIAFLAASVGHATSSDPVSKVLQLLNELQTKIVADGEAEQKAFDKYTEFCKSGSKDKEFEITTAKTNIEDLTAAIGKANADAASAAESINDLAASISTNDADLNAATDIRTKERDEFEASEKELVDTIDMLVRAINILERQLRGTALLEAKVDRADVATLIKTLAQVVDATSLSLHDKDRLTALLQGASGDADGDDEIDADIGAPAPEAYKSHSGSIVDVLEDLRQKAEVQLEELRREEVSAQHTFDLTKQSLEDQVKVDTDALAATKNSKAEAAQTKATAEGELSVTQKALAEAEETLQSLKSGCMRVATDHEASVKSRAEEVKAIATAIATLEESTGAAAQTVYGSSFLQEDAEQTNSAASITAVSARVGSKLHTSVDLVNFEVVNMVRKLARDEKSAALAQLAGRISAAVRAGSVGGADPFAKVKGMIQQMLEKLQTDASQEADHKAYCDKEYAETETKTGELKYDIEKMTSKIDKATAESARLTEEVSDLQASIAATTKSQAEATDLRSTENKEYIKMKTDLEAGLQGVRLALQVLREYYASDTSFAQQQQPEEPVYHEKSTGAGSSIIGMLEVVESDLGKSLASAEMEEETSATEYERVSMDNKMSKQMMAKDVEYKTKQAASLNKAVAELKSDLSSAQTELDAVLEYTTKLRGMCELKPETYEDRAQRREAEIAGLKEALKALDGQALQLLQRHHRVRKSVLRGGTLSP